MQGQLQGFVACNPNEPLTPCQPAVFDVTVMGSGIALANFQVFVGRSVAYGFRDSVSEPVPEPATLGLFGVGALALSALRKRRQRK